MGKKLLGRKIGFAFAAFAFLATAIWAGVGTAMAAEAKEAEKKTAILCVAFGSSVPKGEAAITATVDAVKAAFPGVEVRTAYTSRIIMRKLAREENRTIDDPAIALAKLQFEGYNRVAVLSTNIIPGEEYQDLTAVVEAFAAMRRGGTKSGFDAITLTEPLLAKEADFAAFANVMADTYKNELKNGAVALFGHGSPHFGDTAYSALQMHLWRKSPRFLVGTVEGVPTFEDMAARLKGLKVGRIALVPAMLVAGDHAANDMAGEEEDSWASRLGKAGVKADPKITGLGENPGVRAMFIAKLRSAMKAVE